jgi:hypothetical protein
MKRKNFKDVKIFGDKGYLVGFGFLYGLVFIFLSLIVEELRLVFIAGGIIVAVLFFIVCILYPIRLFIVWLGKKNEIRSIKKKVHGT